MNRIHEDNINTPQHFDSVWTIDEKRGFDSVRMRAFFEGIIKNDDRVLDIGAGRYGVCEYLVDSAHLYTHSNLDLYAVDFSWNAKRQVDALNSRINYIHGDAINTPMRSEWFDLVCAGELIEHIENPKTLVDEMTRVCKRGGWMVISTVNTHCLQYRDHSHYREHLWEFEPYDLLTLFSLSGTTTYKQVGNYHFVYIRKD